jgi:hypothetical protein
MRRARVGGHVDAEGPVVLTGADDIDEGAPQRCECGGGLFEAGVVERERRPPAHGRPRPSAAVKRARASGVRLVERRGDRVEALGARGDELREQRLAVVEVSIQCAP